FTNAFVFRVISCVARVDTSVQSVELIVPSGFIANDPVPAGSACPPSLTALTAPSFIAMPQVTPVRNGAVPVVIRVVFPMMALPPNPPKVTLWMRPFHFAGDGSQISTWIPEDVERAPAGPGLPGPMVSLTRHMSFRAMGGAGVAGVPESASGSPFLNALTSVTVVFASGLNAVIMELSHVNATGQRRELPLLSRESSHLFDASAAGTRFEAATDSPPPQAERRTPAAHVANNEDRVATRILLQPALRVFTCRLLPVCGVLKAGPFTGFDPARTGAPGDLRSQDAASRQRTGPMS